MSTWPDDVLLIHYSELATSAEERLLLLRSIGLLFDKLPGIYDAKLLELETNDWNNLYNWIARSNIPYFWQIVAPTIIVKHVCEKHILVGTKQLINDLKEYKGQQTIQFTVDEAWIAAKYWIESGGL